MQQRLSLIAAKSYCREDCWCFRGILRCAQNDKVEFLECWLVGKSKARCGSSRRYFEIHDVFAG